MHPRTFLRTSDSEHPAKVAVKSRKHSIFTHFPKDRGCDVCFENKITKASAPLRAEKFGDFFLRITKSSMRDPNPETIIGTLSWYKILPHNGFNVIRAKQHIQMRRKKSLFRLSDRSEAPEVVFSDNSMQFGRACEV